MLTSLTIRNFKRFESATIELGKSVVLIGPNNSGKTTALQALALWETGLREWCAKRKGLASPEKRPGVTINRRSLVSIPIPVANLLWRGHRVRDVQQLGGKTKTRNIRIDIDVQGVTEDSAWSCGLEFDYSNEESFVCRPLRNTGFEEAQVKHAEFSTIPDEAKKVSVAYLPPMSGLADREFLKQQGEISFLLGQGQTAQVLRNLCYKIANGIPNGSELRTEARPESGKSSWNEITQHVEELFGVSLLPPLYLPELGEITMQYNDQDGTRLDLSSAGRGLQQTLLLLAHLYANPKTVLLLDEPDAHLEVLRQRQIYSLLTEVAESKGSQIIAASHSEVILNEAAGRGTVVAFVGKPHVINDRGSQLLKSLSSIGWEHYYQAEQSGWVLYLEDSTDFAVLQAFAKLLDHPAGRFLDRPFVHYLSTNIPQRAREHFHGLREAQPNLVGIAVFDRLDKRLSDEGGLRELMWQRREIENYFTNEQVLMAYASGEDASDLFSIAERDKRLLAMKDSIVELVGALETLGEPSPWSNDIKASDQVLDRVFRLYFNRLKLPLAIRKSDYHTLVQFMQAENLDSEIVNKLDAICEVARQATPAVTPEESD